MADPFASGEAAEFFLLVLAAAAAMLAAWHRRTDRGIGPTALLGLVLPGFFLVHAQWAAFLDVEWAVIGLCVLAAFATHLFDLRRRRRG